MIEIKHRYTGVVILTLQVETLRSANLRSADLSGANLRSANLYGANLYGADLRGADLSGADLRSANLRSADLSGADLSGANLRGADLRGANLRGADLRGANLRSANLRGADLSGANLRSANLRSADLYGANLYGADLRGANLSGADLSGVREAMGVEYDPHLPTKIVEQVESNPAAWDQSTWHSECGTRHCIAGFATHLSGELGKYLDKQLGTSTAATLLLWRKGAVLPSFEATASEEDTLGRLRVMAAAVAAGESTATPSDAKAE